MDGGASDAAWLFMLLPEPLLEIFTRRAARPATHVSPWTADQLWATTALAYLKELDTIETHWED